MSLGPLTIEPLRRSKGKTVMITLSGDVACDTCGVILQVGMHPFCPHDGGAPAAFKDGIPGGIVCENYGPNPMRFDSHTERRAYMKAHGLQEKEKFCPMPGTDIDPAGIPNPKGFVDPQTLANGAALILRQQQGREFDGIADGVLGGFYSGFMTGADAAKVGSGDTRRSARLGRRIKDASHHEGT